MAPAPCHSIERLRGFVAALTARGVRVLVAHAPYSIAPESATG
jgi:hypothetical protein